MCWHSPARRASSPRAAQTAAKGGARTAVASSLSPTQAANIQKLVADLQALRANSAVTPAMVQQLVKDTAVLLQGSTKPSQESVQTLATDLKNFTADGKLTPAETAKLQKDLSQVLTEAGIPKSEVTTVVNDVKAIVSASGVTPDQVKTILADIQAIVMEAAATHRRRAAMPSSFPVTGFVTAQYPSRRESASRSVVYRVPICVASVGHVVAAAWSGVGLAQGRANGRIRDAAGGNRQGYRRRAVGLPGYASGRDNTDREDTHKGKAIFEVGPHPPLPQREKRIGDVISEKGKPVQLVFLDEAPLHGRALVEFDKEKNIWVGRFDDRSGKRWKFELRKKRNVTGARLESGTQPEFLPRDASW